MAEEDAALIRDEAKEHEVITRLDRSFITPLDREDIHALISRLDDIVNFIRENATRWPRN